MEETKKTFVTFVLDETGSMMSIRDDTIGGFNSYINTLKEAGEEYLFTLIKFDSNKHDVVCRATPIADVAELTWKTYRPGAATPLIDACVKAIKATEEKVSEDMNVAIVIQTDGEENSSVEFKNEDLVRLIKEKTEAGWLITFLGAGIDAFAQAGKFNIDPRYVLQYDRNSTPTAFAAAAQTMKCYARSGSASSAAWTTEQRQGTGGHMPPEHTTPSPMTTPTKEEEKKSKPIVENITI